MLLSNDGEISSSVALAITIIITENKDYHKKYRIENINVSTDL